MDWLDILHSVWQWVKKLMLNVINFADNIIEFFKNPFRRNQLEHDKNLMAVSIKEKLKSGDYRVVNCLFNKKTDQIVGDTNSSNENAIGLEAQKLDADTQKSFGDKDMIVLQ